jgi:tetratricopeptide (TPR) repeat protein
MSRSVAPSRRPARPAAAPALAALAALAVLAAPGAAAPAPALAAPPADAAERAASPRGTGFEITPAVRQQLQRIQELWLRWVSAGDRERSQAAVNEILATAGQLGMARLPDLQAGALGWAMEAARHQDFIRAAWSLEAAERLDPRRPETAFAEAAVARAAGSYPRAVAALCRACPRLFLLPLERYLWLQDLLIWSLYLLLGTGVLFVGVLLATRGGGLVRDLSALLGRRLPGGVAMVLAAAVLLWPLALPGGLLWAALLWSLLLWGYGSASERAVLIGLWLLLGVSPLLIAAQERAVAVRLSSPVRALESLQQRRLYGGLFSDLGQLRSSLPDSQAVKQLLADVHRTVGQWDLARGLYLEVLEAEPQNAPALLDLGVYSFNRGDTSGAIQYFKQAAAADGGHAAAAYFDLSQAYNEAYLFDEAHSALAQAKAVDAERVDRWLRDADQQRVVALEGGMARIPWIERSLMGPAAGLDLVQHGASLGVALGVILLALALHLARRPLGYAENQVPWRFRNRAAELLRRVLVPGLSSAEAGEGARAFLALLAPVGLLMLPQFERLGYRIPWAYETAGLSAWTVSIVGLLLYLGARLQWELRNAV